MAIIDGDGHVTESPVDGKALPDFLPEEYRGAKLPLGVFPEIDHLHNEPVHMLPDALAQSEARVGPLEWAEFIGELEIEASVVYPSAGLSVGAIASRDWAVATTRAYNDWLDAAYLQTVPELHGMALLPMQDPAAAVDELRRAVGVLGMRGAMLPANGLPLPLGEKEYWPVYAEAERLGCALAVHGGRGARLGFDSLGVRPAGHALGHPISVLISLTSFVFNGVFDHFPGLRVAFLEGGVAWFLVAWERFDRSYWTHIPYNPRRELLELDSGTTVADYLGRLAESGRLVVGCEGSEPDLARAVSLIGSAFMFSSDFPHEVSIQMCKDEIAEIRDSEGISSAQKEDLLAETARRFYRLD